MDGFDFPGSDGKIIPFVQSATHCQWECQKEVSCLRFSFDITNGRCVFKSVNNPTPTALISSGPKFCQKKTSNFLIEYKECGFHVRHQFLIFKTFHLLFSKFVGACLKISMEVYVQSPTFFILYYYTSFIIDNHGT